MGTRADPFTTVAEAAKQAVAAQKRYVLVCNATYDGALSLTGMMPKVEVYGGFTCPTAVSDGWVPTATARPLFRSVDASPALVLEAVTGPLSIANIDFESRDATTPGGTSIAALILESEDVALHSAGLRAGAGADGSDGTQTDLAYPSVTSLGGESATGQTPAPANTCTCPSGDKTIGGAGSAGASKAPGSTGLPNWGEGAGGIVGTCPGTRGSNGAAGPTGTNGEGATVLGYWSRDKWVPAPGANGGIGKPGQGGGGAAGGVKDGGASGGCGGCGGAAGTGGLGGGGSIAMLAVHSTKVIASDVVLTTSTAGRGGAGAAGQRGQQGSGKGGTSPDNCQNGGNGGFGGDGGAGGGAAGGVSVAHAFVGAPVTVMASVVKLGSGGPGGAGGLGKANAGLDGVAVDTLEFVETP